MKTYTQDEANEFAREKIREAFEFIGFYFKPAFPDLFKHLDIQEKGFEVGKVYALGDRLQMIFMCYEVINGNASRYGFDSFGKWFKIGRGHLCSKETFFTHNFREATEDEWYSALKNHAIKLGLIYDNYYIGFNEDTYGFYGHNTGVSPATTLMKDGVWIESRLTQRDEDKEPTLHEMVTAIFNKVAKP